MAVNETIITGRKYRVWDKANSIWKRFSYWTKASDVELNNGTNLENAITEINTNLTFNTNDIAWYGTCPTGAGTQAKVVTTTDTKFALVTGAKVKVKFTYANTHATPTLNVDSKGAKSIKAYGSTAPNMWWKAGDVVEFTYDGTNWIMGATEGQIAQLNNDLTDNNKAFKFGYQNSKYGYYDSGNVFHPFKSGLEETTLWTNSSPGSNFSAQTVNLSKSMYNFDYLRFEFNLATNDAKKTIVIVPVDWFKTTASNSDVGGCAFYSATPRSRVFYYSSATGVYFNNGYSSGTTASSTCIPVSIKGLK